MPRKQTRAVAFGGIITALALVLMGLAGVLPTASYSLAALAGILTMPLLLEFGYVTSLSVFAGVSLLSVLIIPQKEPAVLFILILGWYPIAKAVFERIPSRMLEYIVKFAVFNAAAAAFWLCVKFILLSEIDFGGSFMGKYGVWVLLALANVTFLVYDLALSRLAALYNRVLRPKIHKIFFS